MSEWRLELERGLDTSSGEEPTREAKWESYIVCSLDLHKGHLYRGVQTL